MSIFSKPSLDWITERVGDQTSLDALRDLSDRMIRHLKLSKIEQDPESPALFKDRPFWPLPPRDTAQLYIDGKR